MYDVVFRHIDDAGLMDDAIFLFFCYTMDKGDFSPLHQRYLIILTYGSQNLLFSLNSILCIIYAIINISHS